MNTSFQYCCCISGAIGVGKSTVFDAVCKTMKNEYKDDFIPIREYIDADEIKETSNFLLREYLGKRLTDACFQNYIQSYYINELTHKRVLNKIILMERSMSDSVAIFCNIANRKNAITDLDLSIMYKNCIDTDKVYDFPNYFIKNFEFKLITTETKEQTYQDVLNIIKDDLKHGVKNRVIGLTNTTEKCFARVIERSRSSETYKEKDIHDNVQAYERLFQLIKNPSIPIIRLTDFGYITNEY